MISRRNFQRPLSYRRQINDLKNDYMLLQSDIIIATETNYHLDPKFTPQELEGYQSFHVKKGKGKGKILVKEIIFMLV